MGAHEPGRPRRRRLSSPADTVAGFAAEGGLALRGHNVLWYFRTPHWFFDLPGRREQERVVVDRIRNLVGRYRGLIHSWDVVNEPIEPKDGRPDGLRTAVFLETLGPDYLDLAYRIAHESDPGARLVVNEYDVELDTPAHEARRTALLGAAGADAANRHAGRCRRHRSSSRLPSADRPSRPSGYGGFSPISPPSA